MEEHHDAVGGEVAVRLDVAAAGGVRGGDGGERVLDDGVRGILGGHEAAVGEDARSRRALEPRVRHGAGGSAIEAGPARRRAAAAASAIEPEKAPLMPLSASVNSLGMIQSLLEALSAILGSVCRYW